MVGRELQGNLVSGEPSRKEMKVSAEKRHLSCATGQAVHPQVANHCSGGSDVMVPEAVRGGWM